MTDKLTQYQSTIFNVATAVSYILYIVIALGLSSNAPQYLQTLQLFVKLYVSLFLIIRFNPFRQYVPVGKLDRKIAFSAGIFLLLTSSFTEYLIYYAAKEAKIVVGANEKKTQSEETSVSSS